MMLIKRCCETVYVTESNNGNSRMLVTRWRNKFVPHLIILKFTTTFKHRIYIKAMHSIILFKRFNCNNISILTENVGHY